MILVPISCACFVAALSTTTPDPTALPAPAVVCPSPEPALPGTVSAFTPPVGASVAATGTPAIAEWTRTANPDSVVALTGVRFSSYTGPDEGKDTQFLVYAQNGSAIYNGTASVLRLDGMKTAVVLPSTLPANSEALIWPVNSAGAGTPITVNATEAWWIGPNVATRGDTVSVYGRNLISGATGQPLSHVYIKKTGGTGVWATLKAANPYKVDFEVPTNLADGSYEVWIHNGRGGHYGWSGPLKFNVGDGMPWTNQQFNVKNYGAKGDGVTDDEAAINAAFQAARNVPWSTVYLPAGTYMVSRGFNLVPKVRWAGDGMTKTFIKASAGFVKSATYDDRRYCLLFSDGGVSNVAFQNLTVDGNSNLNGYVAVPVHLRFATGVRFTNVAIVAKGYSIADFHGTNLLSLQGCSLTGGVNGVFFGSATQVQVNGCKVYGTDDVNTMLCWWGGNSMSITDTTGQDFNPAQSDGCAQGRFIYGSSGWGSNRNIYIGNNTTTALAVRPGFSGQNSGEQLLWENGTRYSGTPVGAESNAVTFAPNAIFSDSNLLSGRLDAAVVSGTGVGQHRTILTATGSTIIVSPPWNVPPDTTSTVIIAGAVDRCAVYQNTLQGKSDYATRVTASAGVQPFGNSFEFVADDNTISQVRNGISLWGMSETSLSPQSIDVVYFNYIANNHVHDCLNGITGISAAWNGWPTSDPYPGVSYLANTCVGNTVDSIAETGLIDIADNAPVGDQMDASVFAHNIVTNTPSALDVSADDRVRNAIVYKNALSRGKASACNSVAVALGSGSLPALRDNTYSGFANTYTVMSGPATAMEAPSHVLSVTGSAYGAAVKASLTLWNAGVSPVAWTATTDAAWLTAMQASGSIANESDTSAIELSCNPGSLGAGTYTGNVTVQGAEQTRVYTVTFTVRAATAEKAKR